MSKSHANPQSTDSPTELPPCPAMVWPYTENNICVLGKGHDGIIHKDALGREFDHAGYIKKGKP